MELKEIKWEGMDWIHLTHNRVKCSSSCEHGNKPLGSIQHPEFFR
jgi:hypothetical protein